MARKSRKTAAQANLDARAHDDFTPRDEAAEKLNQAVFALTDANELLRDFEESLDFSDRKSVV